MTTKRPKTPAEFAVSRLTELKGISPITAECLYRNRRRRSFPATAFGYGSMKSRNRLGSVLRHGLVEWVIKGNTIRLTDRAKELIKG